MRLTERTATRGRQQRCGTSVSNSSSLRSGVEQMLCMHKLEDPQQTIGSSRGWQTLGALREGVVVEGAAAHASAAALSVTSKANARAELAVLGAAAAPIRRGSKVWRGAARKV